MWHGNYDLKIEAGRLVEAASGPYRGSTVLPPGSMARRYPQDVRERIFASFGAALTVVQIADWLMVSVSYTSKALGRQRRTGERTARMPLPSYRPSTHYR